LSPRVSFALFLPVGVHLTQGLGLYPVTPAILVGSWLIALAGIVLAIVLYNNEGTRLAITLSGIHRAFQVIMGAVFVTIGAQSLVTGAPLDQGWFALKVLLFGLMFWTSMVVEKASRGLFEPFFEIGKLGSTPEREGLVRKYFNRSLIGVSVIYLEIVAIAFLGATKPF
jgi:heme A synthase